MCIEQYNTDQHCKQQLHLSSNCGNSLFGSRRRLNLFIVYFCICWGWVEHWVGGVESLFVGAEDSIGGAYLEKCKPPD